MKSLRIKALFTADLALTKAILTHRHNEDEVNSAGAADQRQLRQLE